LDDLAAIAQPEDWDDEGSGRQPILFNYLRYTFRRQLELGNWREIESGADGDASALNTGLLSRRFEPIYAVFEPNRYLDRQPWVLTEWAIPSSPRLRDFDLDELRPALYFSGPGEAVFDPRLPVVVDIEQLVHDNVDRYPPELRENDYLRGAMLERAIHNATAKARTNWPTASPQYYWPKGPGELGRLQLLLPLSLLDPDHIDLALVIDRDPPYSAIEASDDSSGSACYRAFTVMPVEWAYRNARLISRPESSWLDPNTRWLGSSDLHDYGPGSWRPTSGRDLCPVCGAAGGCVMKSDNRTVLCRMVPSDTKVRTTRVAEFWSHTAQWTGIPEAASGADGDSAGTNDGAFVR
jgi:hypothetical protein